MGANFPVSFRNGILRAHRRKVLCEREKTVLPALQIYAESRRTMQRTLAERAIIVEKLGSEHVAGDGLGYRYRSLKNKMFVIEYNIRKQRKEIIRLKDITDAAELTVVPALLKNARNTREELKKEQEKVEADIAAIEPEYTELKEKYDTLTTENRDAANLYADRAAGTGQQRREFIMRCPAEDCRGFLSTAYKCGTCEAWACKECHVSIGKDKDLEHTCDADTLLSAKAIKEETRPCPKCGTRIFKIIGCDQMYCVMEGCGTAFSWTSGQIVTGVIHNPHYYEWLRRKEGGHLPREAGDIPCGGMPGAWEMVGTIRELELPDELNTILLESYRNLNELVEHRLREFPSRLPQLANKDDDVEYLMNEISQDEWQIRLERTETKFNRRKEIGQILQTLATAGADMMNRIYREAMELGHETPNQEKFCDWLVSIALPELEQLRIFGNESLLALAKRDRTAVPQLEENWTWKGLRAIYTMKTGHCRSSSRRETTEIVEEVLEDTMS